MAKQNPTYHVRVRVDGVKKSVFIDAKCPKDARDAYKGKGDIMWCRKVGMERLFGVGEFFKLGDDLLQELKSESTNPAVVNARVQNKKEENRVLKRRGYNGNSTREGANETY